MSDQSYELAKALRLNPLIDENTRRKCEALIEKWEKEDKEKEERRK